MVYQERLVVETITEITHQKTILFGAHGMLGHALQEVFPHAQCIGHNNVDITDEDAIMKLMRRERPAILINAAAYTDVDGCEDNRVYAFAVNGTGPGYIAKACTEVDAILVHISTDYIFDGTLTEYREDDQPNPINAYGESKLLGEVSIAKNLENYRIIRTSWLYGRHGKNFVDTILTLSRQMPVVRVVNDQIGKPTYTVDLANKVPEILSCDPGMYHITNDGQCSWYEFASAFIPNAIPCSTAEFPRKARRPAYSVLANTKTPPLRHWKEAVQEYVSNRGKDLK
jgi:dTDP-4-dehydrorhamnose reductase